MAFIAASDSEPEIPKKSGFMIMPKLMINKSLLGDLSLIYLNTKKSIYKIYQNSSFYDKKISKVLIILIFYHLLFY